VSLSFFDMMDKGVECARRRLRLQALMTARVAPSIFDQFQVVEGNGVAYPPQLG
jgi:hypothetical protein